MLAGTLLIRADASSEMGIGHVMRCLALGDAWRDCGGRVVFALASGAQELGRQICAHNAKIMPVQAVPGSAKDGVRLLELGDHSGAEWLVVDGYHFSAEYLRTLDTSRFRLLVISDDGEFPDCDCDIVVDPGIQVEKANAKLSHHGELLAGPGYALLRREFLECAKQDKDIPESARRILVTFGGGDFPNASLTVVDALNGILDCDLNVTVVIGPSNPHRRELQRAASESRHSIDLVEVSNNMADIMAQADMAVTGGGGTCYELSLMRVPMVLIPIAENQMQLASAYASADAAVLAGTLGALNRVNLAEVLHRVIGDRALRQRLVDRASTMVDGKGARRIVQRMLTIGKRETTDSKARN